MVAHKIVFRKQGHTIERTLGIMIGEGPLYSVYDPNNNLILGNRKSLKEAKSDLDNYIKIGGHKKFEDIGELLTSTTYFKGFDIDPEIKDVVKELNDMGYTTVGSCAGHEKVVRFYYGFINFSKLELSRDDKDEIRSILRTHNLHTTKFTPSRVSKNYTGVYFNR